MGREAMIRADMESVGIYSPIFDSTIKQLAKLERELSRAEKSTPPKTQTTRWWTSCARTSWRCEASLV
mgnify:CR=1 FL=1